MTVDLIDAIQRRRIKLADENRKRAEFAAQKEKQREELRATLRERWTVYIADLTGLAIGAYMWEVYDVEQREKYDVFSVRLHPGRHPEFHYKTFPGVLHTPHIPIELDAKVHIFPDGKIIAQRNSPSHLWMVMRNGVGWSLFEDLIDAIIFAVDSSVEAKSRAGSRPSPSPSQTRNIPDPS